MTKKVTFCFVAVFALLAAQLWAEDQWIDVVYLKDGSIVKGMVIEQVPNESLKIQTADGSVFVYKMADVSKIAKEKRATDTAAATDERARQNAMAQIQLQLPGLMPLSRLRNVTLNPTDVAALTVYEKQMLYNRLSRNDAGLALLGNLLIPGLGSYVIGNNGWATYHLLSYVGLGVYALVAGYGMYYSTSGMVISVSLSANYLIAFIGDLVSPFTYQTQYNNELRMKLGM